MKNTVPLQISHSEARPGVAVISLAGKVMLGAESEAIERLVRDLLKQGYRKLIIDMSGVTHIDSTGIGRFIASLGKVMEVDGTLLMAGAAGVVREGFRVTRLDTVFQFYPDLEAAVAAI